MRKILYSPGYGAGWTSWNMSLPKEAITFMLEYKPFIEYLESGKDFKKIETVTEVKELPIVIQFFKDFKATFPNLYTDGEEPYICILGIDDLAIYEVEDNDRIRIDEYDGNENVMTQENTNWY